VLAALRGMETRNTTSDTRYLELLAKLGGRKEK
jgi:hypothetical protein